MAGYGTDELFANWLAANGYSLPDDAPAVSVLRQRGSVYVDGTYGVRFPGLPTGGVEQERAWPRTGATIYGTSIASDLIPNRVIEASYMAAYIEATKPGSLAAITDPAKRVKRQKVDTIEREFFEPGGGSVFAPDAPVSTVIEGLLAPLIGPAFDEPSIMVV